jgi:hypothetical protein
MTGIDHADVSLLRVLSGVLDRRGDLPGMGDVDWVAAACGFDRVAMSSLGVPSFKVRVDGSVFCRYQHPTWFAPPRRRGDDCLDIVRGVEY